MWNDSESVVQRLTKIMRRCRWTWLRWRARIWISPPCGSRLRLRVASRYTRSCCVRCAVVKLESMCGVWIRLEWIVNVVDHFESWAMETVWIGISPNKTFMQGPGAGAGSTKVKLTGCYRCRRCRSDDILIRNWQYCMCGLCLALNHFVWVE